jgi:L-rhamnose mutarotase
MLLVFDDYRRNRLEKYFDELVTVFKATKFTNYTIYIG